MLHIGLHSASKACHLLKDENPCLEFKEMS